MQCLVYRTVSLNVGISIGKSRKGRKVTYEQLDFLPCRSPEAGSAPLASVSERPIETHFESRMSQLLSVQI